MVRHLRGAAIGEQVDGGPGQGLVGLGQHRVDTVGGVEPGGGRDGGDDGATVGERLEQLGAGPGPVGERRHDHVGIGVGGGEVVDEAGDPHAGEGGQLVEVPRAVRLQERHGRGLRVVSGVAMLALAVVLLTAPEVMEQVAGALAVFAAAGGGRPGVAGRPSSPRPSPGALTGFGAGRSGPGLLDAAVAPPGATRGSPAFLADFSWSAMFGNRVSVSIEVHARHLRGPASRTRTSAGP